MDQKDLLTQLERDNESLRNDIDSIQLERDRFRAEAAKLRTDLAQLQARFDEADCQVADLTRKMGRQQSSLSNVQAQVIEVLAKEPVQQPLAAKANVGSEAGTVNDDDAPASAAGDDSDIEIIEDPARMPAVQNTIAGAKDLGSQNKPKNPQPEVPSTSSIRPAPESLSTIKTEDSTSSSSLKRSATTEPSEDIIKSSPQVKRLKIDEVIENHLLPSGIVAEMSSSGSTRASTRTKVSSSIRGASPAAIRTDVQMKMNQPSIKIKKEAFQLPVENINRYLSGAVPLVITPPPPKFLHIPRKLLRITYGGSDQQFVAHCDVEKSPFSRRASDQSQRHIVFPVPDLNPYMPTSPGDTGLIFASRHEVLEDPPWSVFRRVRESPAVWEYQGEYLCTLCGKMTASEFSSQRIEVKTTWAKLILKSLKLDVYVSMRARIALRAKNRPLTDETVKKEVSEIKDHRGIPLTEQEVISAFNRGDEAIDVIRMECTSYDQGFAADIALHFGLGTISKNANVTAATGSTSKRRARVSERNTDEDLGEASTSTNIRRSSRQRAPVRPARPSPTIHMLDDLESTDDNSDWLAS